MNNFNVIGSVYKGVEYYYIFEHFNKNKSNIVYIARDDREIYQIKNKLEWLVPNINISLYLSWDQIPYDKVSPSKCR